MSRAGGAGRGSQAVVLSAAPMDQVIRRHSKSFYFASRLLPERKRADTWVLYAWCRHVDDLVDEAQERPDEALSGWRAWLGGASDRVDPGPLATAVRDVMARNNISPEPFLDLLDGVESDVRRRRMATWAELREYSRQVASTVGLMLVRVYGRLSDEADEHAADLGLAMQLTNVLRDVGEDLRERDRIYLPAEEMTRHGVSEEDLIRQRVSEGFIQLMREQIARARDYYTRAQSLYACIEPDARMACATAACVYADILRSIERNGYDVLTRRAIVSSARKLALIPRAWSMARS